MQKRRSKTIHQIAVDSNEKLVPMQLRNILFSVSFSGKIK